MTPPSKLREVLIEAQEALIRGNHSLADVEPLLEKIKNVLATPLQSHGEEVRRKTLEEAAKEVEKNFSNPDPFVAVVTMRMAKAIRKLLENNHA